MNIVLQEHQPIAYQELSRTGIKIHDFPDRPDKSVYLGLTSDLRQQTVRASYYIGLSWLKEGECSVSVLPKINVDYLQMFMDCFYSDDNDIQDKLMQIYFIDFDKFKNIFCKNFRCFLRNIENSNYSKRQNSICASI